MCDARRIASGREATYPLLYVVADPHYVVETPCIRCLRFKLEEAPTLASNFAFMSAIAC